MERRINAAIPETLYKKLKHLSDDSGVPVARLLKFAVTKYLEARGKPASDL
jgi:hypothetical protein